MSMLMAVQLEALSVSRCFSLWFFFFLMLKQLKKLLQVFCNQAQAGITAPEDCSCSANGLLDKVLVLVISVSCYCRTNFQSRYAQNTLKKRKILGLQPVHDAVLLDGPHYCNICHPITHRYLCCPLVARWT